MSKWLKRIGSGTLAIVLAISVLGYLVPAQPTRASGWTLITTATCSFTHNGCTTSAVNTTGADLFVSVITCYASLNNTGSPFSMSDSQGNTWVKGTTVYGTFNANYVRIDYSSKPTTSSSQTFSIVDNIGSGDYPYCSISIEAFSGSASSPLDQTNGANGGSSGYTSIQPGSVTPTQNNELIVAGFDGYGASTLSINGSFSIAQQQNAISQQNGVGYLDQSTAGAVNPTWSWTTSGGAAAAIETFKGTGGGGGSTTQPSAQPSKVHILSGFFHTIGGFIRII